MAEPDFEVHRADVRGVSLAYWREGEGGFPLLLLHGWPETKRIWSRNVEPLAAAGFEVIVPDMRGFGDSGLADDGHYDTVSISRDLHALVTEVLGHPRCVTCAGDAGGFTVQDMAMRFEGFVVRQVLFNTVPPLLGEAYAEAGIPVEPTPVTSAAADYFVRQALHADELAAEMDTPEKRRRYVSGMYGHRFWAAPGAFTAEEVEFHVEPFGDADSFRASIAHYEYALGGREPPERPLMFEPIPTPTLVLYGPEDHVIPSVFPDQARIAFPELVGPFTVPGAGHFLQWEQAKVLNQSVRYFCSDLLASGAA